MCEPYVVVKINKDDNYTEIHVANHAIFSGYDINNDISRILAQYMSMGYEIKIKET